MELSQTLKETKVSDQGKTENGVFPKVYSPALQENSHVCLQQYFTNNKDQIIQEIEKHGAVLFRGFEIKSPNEAIAVLNKLGLKSFEYVGGAAVRKLVVGSQDRSQLNSEGLEMFTTNEAPPNQPIPFHNELLQTPNYPDHVAFYCQTPAIEKGATPIVSSSQLYEYVKNNHGEFLKQLQEKGIRYIRVIGEHDNPKSPIGRGWRNVFKVSSKEEAQKAMKAQNYECQWLQNGDCKLISQKLQAITKAKCGLKVFANQILAVFQGWKDDKNTPQKCLKFGDNSEIPIDVVSSICQQAQKIKVTIPWEEGDIILIDNLMTMHAREPFKGPFRKVFACLMKGKIEKVQKQVSQILHTGYELPLMGFGTWKIPNEQCQDKVYTAIKNGYRLIDCACDYGNQVEVGRGIKKAVDAGIVTRKQLFITTKLWNTYHRPQHVRPAFQKQLKDLGLQYIDLYLMHFPVSIKFIPFEQRYPPGWVYDEKAAKKFMWEDRVPIIDTWKAMEELVYDGKVKNIGVSNFRVSLLRELIYQATIKPAVLQVQIHPELTQKRLIRFCREEGIQVTSYSTFGASSYVELGMASEEDPMFKHPLIKDLGKKYSRTPHQIILRWALQQGLAIIPKSSKEQRIKENFDVTKFCLSAEDIKSINELNKDKRYNDPGYFCEKAFGTFFPIHD